MELQNLDLEEIYHNHYKNVYRYILFRINNHHDAQDLANDVFVKAIRNQKNFNPTLSIEGWLITIAKNTVVDYLRKHMRLKFISLDNAKNIDCPANNPEEAAIASEEITQLLYAMNKLKPKERQILSMKFTTGLKHKEIANILNITETNARVSAHMALNKLKKYMKESG